MPRLLVIGYVWPEPASSAAGARMMQLIEFFKKENCEITFATTAKETENKIDLSSLGIDQVKIKLNDPEFDDFLKGLMPEIVLFDRFMMEEQFGWRVDSICPETIKILDTEDLHFLRNARQQAFKEKSNAEDIYKNSELAKREIAAIYRSDLSLIISEPEMELLRSDFRIPDEILFFLPFMLDPITENEQKELPGFSERKDFISIGNFLHEPNWNAVLFLKEKIWPELRKQLPAAKMNVFGAYPSQKVLNLHNPKENFLVHGWAEDANLVMKNSRVCLAPIQFGAGLKGKLVEAMKNGTPSVTTSIGAEGISDLEKWNGYITNDVQAFIENSKELYNNEELWREKQNTGFEIYNERFNLNSHQERLRKVLSQIKTNSEEHRNSNFTGKMLKHHLHKSTYFMSRFIEEKNRNKN
ncbi:glycosyltransferase involved in cell wall biosynthesis [Christiangramia gaetbulicola]|uniref:Glycosyltransferase involved in cell wall biosynthesis n=1 Tax=Christiangramia gaetbulicola TaxID=703340 RepID=A0A2T6AH38_9FLAO|nr:glycosyltransferase family 4 protein [Christiangramia gaetbulicola]PTX43140.1 glycosyltransferase involved in cell wall biosynthesis [Christiangramia gaetbulicola]